MAREDDVPVDDVVFIDVGSGRLAVPRAGGINAGPASRSPNGRRRVAGVVAAIVLVTIVVAVVSRSASHRPAAVPSPSAMLLPSVANRSTLPVDPVSVTNIGHPLLGVTGAWDLFGRGTGVLVRVQMALGQVTRTTLPVLGSTGPVSFVTSPDEAIVRPLDSVPGYAVPDGRGPLKLTGRLDQGGPVFGARDPRHLWVTVDDGVRSRVDEVSVDGKPTGVSIALPADANSYPRNDGGGGVLLTTAGGVYQGYGSLQRISTGELLAVGPSGWLVRECATRGCETVLVSRDGGSRSDVPVSLSPPGRIGLISPDARTAAVLDQQSPLTSTLELVDLVSGRQRPVGIVVEPDGDDSSLVWSPDNRWLFAIAEGGRLVVVNAIEGTSAELIGSLPALRQLAIRNVVG